jgi:hypothetical protein
VESLLSCRQLRTVRLLGHALLLLLLMLHSRPPAESRLLIRRCLPSLSSFPSTQLSSMPPSADRILHSSTLCQMRLESLFLARSVLADCKLLIVGELQLRLFAETALSF